jgi:hypothetical protein
MLSRTARGLSRAGRCGALILAAGFAMAQGCAQGSVAFKDGSTAGSGGTGGTSSGGTGGSGGQGGTMELPCQVDCGKAVKASPCHQAVCDTVGKQCKLEALPDDSPCEDGLFCTVQDTCKGGMCMGGSANTCATNPPACHEMQCQEATKTCEPVASMDGASCTPEDKCQINGQCQFGTCMGKPNMCQFDQAPDKCHVMVCDPADGVCKPQVGNDGKSCDPDAMDLCTVGKLCSAGVCQGGAPKNCSALTKGCTLGVCDVADGACKPKAVNDGDKCDDLNACTTNETCSNGTCGNGTQVTQCKNGDACCPAGCSELNDDDCGCTINLAKTATPLSNGGGADASGYGPKSLSDGVDEKGCQAKGCNQCFCWINNSTAPSGAYVEYDWVTQQTIGSIHVDAKDCNTSCSSQGRTMFGGKVQWWDGATWQTAQTFTNNDGDLKMTFNPKLKTTKLRIYDITAANCGQTSNTMIYEWGVWAGSTCALF